MFKRLQNLVLVNLGVMLLFISGLGLDSRCMFSMYEPDIPDCLKGKE